MTWGASGVQGEGGPMSWEDYLGLMLVIIIAGVAVGAFALVLRLLWLGFVTLWHLIPL